MFKLSKRSDEISEKKIKKQKKRKQLETAGSRKNYKKSQNDRAYKVKTRLKIL